MSVYKSLQSALRDPALIGASVASNLLGLAIPLAMIQIYDRIIPNEAYETLIVLAAVVLTTVVAEMLLRGARHFLLGLAGQRFEFTAYAAALRAIMNQPSVEASRQNEGTLFTQLSSIDRLREIYTGPSIMALLDLPFAFLFLFVIMLISPFTGGAVLVVLSIAFLILRSSRTKVTALQEQRKEIEAQRHSFLAEVLRAMSSVKSQGIEGFMRRRYERLLSRSGEKTFDMNARIHTAQGFAGAIGSLAPLFVCCIGAYSVIHDAMTVGSLAAMVLLTGRIVQPVLQFEAFLAGSETARNAREDLDAILNLPTAPDGKNGLWGVCKLDLVDVETEAEPRTGMWFEGLNVSLKTGDCITLDAPNPLYQSAFLRVLGAEAAFRRGQYLINDQPAEAFRSADRAEAVRLLGPESQLIEGTIMENMTNFAPDLHRHRALALASEIGVDRFFSESADGYETQIGSSNDVSLPKSIADATLIVSGLVTEPDVILFDEANAALDLETDQKLLTLLERLRPNSIIVLVTGRPSFRNIATGSLDLTPHARGLRVPGAMAVATPAEVLQ